MGLISQKLGVKSMAYLCRMLAQSSRGSVQIDRQYIEEGAKHYVLMLQFSFFALLVPAILVAYILQGLAAGVVMVFAGIRDMLGG